MWTDRVLSGKATGIDDIAVEFLKIEVYVL